MEELTQKIYVETISSVLNDQEKIILSIIQGNDLSAPFNNIIEYINAVNVLSDKQQNEMFKQELMAFAYEHIKDRFAIAESKLSSNELHEKLTKAVKVIYEYPIDEKKDEETAVQIAKLIMAGADANLEISQHKENHILFHIAKAYVEQPWSSLVPLLKIYGAKFDGRNAKGLTVLKLAIKNWNTAMVKQLIVQGVQVEKSDLDFARSEIGDTAKGDTIISILKEALKFQKPRELFMYSATYSV